MLLLTTTNSIKEAPPDTTLQSLLHLRLAQLTQNDGGIDVGEYVHFLIVEPGDTPVTLAAELGFSILESLVDGTRHGDPEFEPSWEWSARHDGWFELVFIVSDDGFAHVVLVPDREGIDAAVLALCREHAPAS